MNFANDIKFYTWRTSREKGFLIKTYWWYLLLYSANIYWIKSIKCLSLAWKILFTNIREISKKENSHKKKKNHICT